jgi:hypothetical protein
MKSPWLRHGLPVVLCIACIAALPEAYEREKANWRELARPVAGGASIDHAMIVQSRGPDDWRARCMYVCLRYYAPQPVMPLALLSRPEPDVLREIGGRDVWLFGGGQNVPLELVPGWQRVEWDYIPDAGTVTRLRDSQPE